MVKKKEEDVGFVRQFNDLKKKHPDAMVRFGSAKEEKSKGLKR